MAGYSQQVLISTGRSDWRSRIEEDGVDEEWGILGRGLKGLIGRGGKYSDVGIPFFSRARDRISLDTSCSGSWELQANRRGKVTAI